MLHRFGPFELDERRFELRRHGKPVAIQRKVLETIAFLVKNPDRLISKDELIEGPWKGTTVSDASLARVIMMARKTLTDRGRLGHLIQTARGKGYRFLAEVTSSSTAGSSTTRTDSSSSTTSRSAAAPIGRPPLPLRIRTESPLPPLERLRLDAELGAELLRPQPTRLPSCHSL